MTFIEPLPENRDAIRRLEALARAGENLRPAMRKIAEALQAGVERSFAAEASPDGKPWAPLAKSTLRQREKSGYDGPILQRRRRGSPHTRR